MLLQPFSSLLLLLSIFSSNTAVLALSKKAEIAVIVSTGGLSLVVLGGVLYCRYNKSPFKTPMFFRNAKEVESNQTFRGLSLEEQTRLLSFLNLEMTSLQLKARFVGMSEDLARQAASLSHKFADAAKGPDPVTNAGLATSSKVLDALSKTPIAPRNVRAPAELPAVRSPRSIPRPPTKVAAW